VPKTDQTLKPLVAAHLEALAPYVPGLQVEELERQIGVAGAIKLASNENPLGPSPHALTAASAAVSGVHIYPDDTALTLRERLADVHGVTLAHVALGHGSNELIDMIARTFATPSDHAIVGHPSFSCYALSLTAAHVPTTTVALSALHWDLDTVRAAIRAETKLIFLDHPGNPSSTHIPAPELRAFLEAVPADVIVVVDEAYADFADAPDFESALAMRDLRERLVVLRTFSKSYALAALRVGYAIAPPEIIDYLQRVRLPFNVNSVGQAAALAALSDRPHLMRCVVHNARERARLAQALRGLGLGVAPSQTNFVLVDFGRPTQPIYQELLKAGIIVRPFGPPLHQHLRISIGLTHENDRLLQVLTQVLGARSARASAQLALQR